MRLTISVATLLSAGSAFADQAIPGDPAVVASMAVSSATSARPLDDDLAVRSSAPTPPARPTLVLELSGAGAYVANPYVEYKGWTFETGAGKSGRVEVNLVGIQLGYELTSMANQQACSDGCLTGAFGSTTIHAVDLGYRFRFAPIGPVRPFLTASLGGVAADSSGWSMTAARTVYGGQGRAGLGIEIPIADRFFASATLAYKFIVTENPMRNLALEQTQAVFVGGGDPPIGDYAEDLHLATFYAGIGVQL